MNNFFKTLVEPNLPNVMKWLGGVAVSSLTLIASGVIPGLPLWLVLGATIATGGGAVLGVHKAHVSEPPSVSLDKR